MVIVKEDDAGSYCVEVDGIVVMKGLTHAQAWAEADRRTARPNWKSSACEFRNLGSFDHGKVTPWTNPKARKKWQGKKKMHRRAPLVRSRGCNRKYRHGRTQ
jgi:hypothetical protein